MNTLYLFELESSPFFKVPTYFLHEVVFLSMFSYNLFYLSIRTDHGTPCSTHFEGDDDEAKAMNQLHFSCCWDPSLLLQVGRHMMPFQALPTKVF